MKKKPKKGPDWPEFTVACPDDITGQLLRYWEWLLTPRKNVWTHPDDISRNADIRKKIRALLETGFFA